MALIKCPKCGETISDKVVICPNCNALLDNNTATTEKPSKVLLGCGFVALIIAIAILIFGFWAISSGGILFVIIGFFVFAVACFFFNEYRKDVYKHHLAKTDKIVNISTAKKVVSTEMLGLASNQIGKTYQCDECKYIW